MSQILLWHEENKFRRHISQEKGNPPLGGGVPTVAAFSAASARRFFSIELRRRIRPVFIQALRAQAEGLHPLLLRPNINYYSTT